MRAQDLNLVGAESAVSHDACGLVGSPIALTFTQIASLFYQYREELIRRLIGMVKSRETAADLVQDAYLRLLRVGDQDVVEQPRAFLYKIATNLAIDHLRKEKHRGRRIDCFDAAMAVPCHAPSPERELLGNNGFAFFCRQSNICHPELVRLFCSAVCMGTPIKRLRHAWTSRKAVWRNCS